MLVSESEIALVSIFFGSRRRRTTGDNKVRPPGVDWFDSGFFLGRPRRLGGGSVGGEATGGVRSGDDKEESESIEAEFRWI